MSISTTDICNMALARLGANRIISLADTSENTTPAIQCRLHYEQTKTALIRSYRWSFARGRETLSVSSDTPDFEYDFQYTLPSDYLYYVSPYENQPFDVNIITFTIEGAFFLTNDTEVELRYIKNIDDATKFDPLFVEVLILRLAKKMLPALAGSNTKLARELAVELEEIEAQARAVAGQESNSIGTSDMELWNDARFKSNDPSRF